MAKGTFHMSAFVPFLGLSEFRRCIMICGVKRSAESGFLTSAFRQVIYVPYKVMLPQAYTSNEVIIVKVEYRINISVPT